MVTVVLVVPFVIGAGRQTLVQEKKVENTQLTWGSLGATVTVVLVVLFVVGASRQTLVQ